MLGFLSESTKNFKETETIGSFSYGSNKNNFDALFTEAADELAAANVDIMTDINTIIKEKVLL